MRQRGSSTDLSLGLSHTLILSELSYCLRNWHWFSVMGTFFAFRNNHLCHLNLENFMPRQTPLEEAQSDSRNFSGGKMDTKEIVHHPVNT